MPDPIKPDLIMPGHLTRRRFLRRLAVLGGTALLPAAAAPAEAAAAWVPVGPASGFAPGRVTHVVLPDAFSGEELFVTADGHGGYAALSARCTHKGCLVDWDAHGNRFQCPCHGGAFAPDGRPLCGPPRAALTSLPVRVDAHGVVQVQPRAS